MTGVVLLDRDGVINRDRLDYVREPSQLQLLPGILTAFRYLRKAGYRVLVITNQSCVGRGLVSEEALKTIHDDLRRRVSRRGGQIDGVYACLHTPEDGCACRKPEPGLILEAQRDWDFNCADTWMVGDARRDIEAALAAGCKPALVLTGKGRQTATETPGIASFPNLLGFVQYLLATTLTDGINT